MIALLTASLLIVGAVLVVLALAMIASDTINDIINDSISVVLVTLVLGIAVLVAGIINYEGNWRETCRDNGGQVVKVGERWVMAGKVLTKQNEYECHYTRTP